jgi:hypothetical protein
MKKTIGIITALVLFLCLLPVGISVTPSLAYAACPEGIPTTPSPANLSTSISVNADLDWAGFTNASYYEVYFGTNPSPSDLVGSPNASDWALSTLSSNTTYYWKVVAFNGSTCNTSDNSSIWSFTTCVSPPGTPVSESPLNTSTDIYFEADLNWGDCINASYYEVYFGTNPSPSALNGSPNASAWALPTLSANTTYYWKVVAVNSSTCNTSGPVWSFTTANAPTPTVTACPTPSVPSSPTPSDTLTSVAVETDLSWGACSNITSYIVYFGTNSTPTTQVGNPTTNSWPLSTLAVNTTYYWKVVAVNSCGTNNSGPIWRFTTMSAAPVMPEITSPLNNSIGVALDADLDWADSFYTDSYDVYFGTSASALVLQGNSMGVSYWALDNLSTATTYYWKIVAKNSYTTTNGATWTFSTSGCTAPGVPSYLSPGNVSTNVSVDADLDWDNASYATSYQVYFGTSASALTLRSTSPTVSNLSLDRLSTNTTYYWKVVARSACGSTNGSIWSFTTECVNVSKPQLTSPVNASTNQSLSITLNWSAVGNASLYDVYLSTNSTPTYHGNTSNSSYQATLSNYSTKYYWKIVAKNNCGNNSSDIWEFTTGVAPAVTPTPTPTATPTAVPTPTPTAVAGAGAISVPLNIDSSGVLQQAVDVTSSDNKIRLRMPSGGTALDSAGQPIQVINMSVTEIHPAPPEDRIIIAAFNFSPNGARFHPYITITLDYTNDMIPADVNESTLVIAFYNESSSGWEYLSNGVINANANTITFTVDHFTVFSIQTPPVQHGGGLATWVIIVIVFGDAVVLGLIVGLYIKYRRIYGRMAPEGDEGDAYDEYNEDVSDQGGDEDFKF